MREATTDRSARFTRRASDRPFSEGDVRAIADSEERTPEPLRRSAVVRRALAAADLLAATAALLAVAGLGGHTPRPSLLVLAGVVLLTAKLNGLYERDEVRIHKSTLEEVPALVQLTGLSALVLWLSGTLLFEQPLGRGEVADLWGLMAGFVIAARVAARRVASRRLAPERCLVVGEPEAAMDVTAKLEARGAVVVGFLPLVDRRRREAGESREDPCAGLESVFRRARGHRVVVVPGTHGEADPTLLCVSRAQAMGAQVSILPRISEVVGSSVEFDHVDGMTLLGVHRFGLSRSSRLLKRAVDVVMSALAIAVVSPLLAGIALAIRLDGPGPILFRQRRMGFGGEPFDMLKFRSMVDDAHALRDGLHGASHAGDGLFKVASDPRITAVGAVLRRFSLDELPQLFNVLRGDMSLVGPRPLVLEEDRNITWLHRRGRLKLTPGMTGPWQVLGTRERRVPLRDMVTLDLLYAGNWSLWTDVKILLRTVVHVARGHGL